MLKDKEKRKKKDKSETSPQPGIGAYLREAREKANMALEEVYEKTKLRTSLIEALEEENWELLPSRTFVRGFVRSYAVAVGLDPQEALARFEASVPSSEEQFKPLSDTASKRSLVPVLLGLLLIFSLAFLFFLTRNGAKQEQVADMKPLTSESSQPKPPPVKETKQETSSPAQEKPQTQLSLDEQQELEPQVTPVTTEDLTPAPPEPAPVPLPVESPGPSKPPLLLKAFVKERTWMRIQVDQGTPKEYIFSPGAQPQWQGEEVFDIMIGNAAGIQFELNGKKIENLGKRGQVVRLRLPRSEEISQVEE